MNNLVEKKDKCAFCEGKGATPVYITYGSNILTTGQAQFPPIGAIPAYWLLCSVCKGTGFIRKEGTL